MKKINLVYDWIGPHGPMRNGEYPDIMDIIRAAGGNVHSWPNRISTGFLPGVLRKAGVDFDIYSSYKIPNGPFIYEITTLECARLIEEINGPEGFFTDSKHRYRNHKILNDVRERKGYIFISNPFESFLEDSYLMSIHHLFQKLEIPLEQVIYSTCCPNGDEIYKEFCKRHGINGHLNCEFLPVYSLDLRKEYTDKHFLPSEYNIGHREKDFLIFNRRYRDQRLLIGLLFEKENLLDRVFFSLDKTQPERGTSFREVAQGFVYDPAWGITNEIFDKFESRLPLILDLEDFNQLNQTLMTVKQRSFYNRSLVHIISETNFFTPIIHQTEKTLKPMANLQPFIMLGSVGSLKGIKDMGYETFSDFWDESYDEEKDDKQRLLKIVDLCKTISAWSKEDKLEFTKKIKPRIEYNYNHFMKGKVVALEKLREKYGQ